MQWKQSNSSHWGGWRNQGNSLDLSINKKCALSTARWQDDLSYRGSLRNDGWTAGMIAFLAQIFSRGKSCFRICCKFHAGCKYLWHWRTDSSCFYPVKKVSNLTWSPVLDSYNQFLAVSWPLRGYLITFCSCKYELKLIQDPAPTQQEAFCLAFDPVLLNS